MDYQGLYEDLLAMEARANAKARQCGIIEFGLFVEECRLFRVDLLLRFYNPIGHVRIV